MRSPDCRTDWPLLAEIVMRLPGASCTCVWSARGSASRLLGWSNHRNTSMKPCFRLDGAEIIDVSGYTKEIPQAHGVEMPGLVGAWVCCYRHRLNL